MVRMGAQSDQVKGHAKEAAGIVTGNKDLRAEGKADRRAGEAEEKIDRGNAAVHKMIASIKNRIDKTIHKTKDALHRN